MVFEITVFNDGGANDGKIRLKVTDNEGLTGTMTAYWGLTAPDGTVIRNIASSAGTFGSSGSLSVLSDIPIDTLGAYLGGTYLITGTVKNGSDVIATNSMSALYDPRVKPGDPASADAVVSATSSCADATVTVTDESKNTGYTVASTVISLTPPPTTANPTPDAATTSAVTDDFSSSGDGTYGYSTTVTRTKTLTDPDTTFPMTFVVSEVITAVGQHVVACTTWCAAADSFATGVVACHDSVCAAEWEMTNHEKDKAIQALSYAVQALLKDKCGDGDAAVAALTKLTNLGSSCSTSCNC